MDRSRSQEHSRNIKASTSTESGVEDDWSDSKMSSVITYVDRQRMYCQKVTKEILLIYLEHEIEDNLWLLKDSVEKFEYIQRALRFGDHQLYIPPTTDQETLEHLNFVDQLWKPFEEEIRIVLTKGYVNQSDIEFISTLEPPLEIELLTLLHLYEGLAEQVDSTGEIPLPRATVLAIEYAGSQRLLCQKMVADYLFVVIGYEEEEHMAGLQEDVAEFDNVMQALYYGDTEIGLHAAESPDLIIWLDRCSEIWEGENGFKAVMSAEPTYFMLDYLASQNIPLLGRLNVVVGLFKKIATTPPPPPSEPPPPDHPPGWNNGSDSLLGTCTLFLAGGAMISFSFFGNSMLH
eukprot:CAMPEP_0196573578 /NCGR_PEP_ID=MMETSP1081-20130531/3457_1 /TAXON_ID=36882 /ORGANISM="Pyramimonas amylifera, Strain CCMP720" /LENGTH=346 /DNA_ID=CAMNT_0041891335 /DNA_START=156 /DNA_END=1196 /DNA_ORIENTATION=+